MDKVYIAGVNGSGKSTILNLVANKRPEFVVMDSSKHFMEFLGLGDDYEKLRALSTSERDSKLEEFMIKVLEDNKNSTLLFAGHPLNLVRGEITEVGSDWMDGFNKIVLITSQPDMILNRIKVDSRDRQLFDDVINQESIWSDYMVQYEEKVKSLSKKYDLEYLRLENNEGDQQKSADLLIEFVDKFK